MNGMSLFKANVVTDDLNFDTMLESRPQRFEIFFISSLTSVLFLVLRLRMYRLTVLSTAMIR